MRASVRLAALVAVLALGGCLDRRPPATVEPAAEYETLFPFYAEACAVSQIAKKPGFGADIRGGIGGHAVLYLNGVCRVDGDSTRIGLCDGPSEPGRGVGLSVNAHYQNTKWVATEGRDFFYRGGLSPRERLTRLAYRRVQEAARAQGLFDRVTFHEEALEDRPPDMSVEDWKYEISIGTDYGIELARNRYCVRVPLDRDRMARVADYLNGLNAPYRSGAARFHWSVLQDNCSHLIHNALTVAGIWAEWETDRPLPFAALEFPVPKNEFVNLARRTNDLPLGDLMRLYEDPALRDAVIAQGVIPTAPGALAAAVPAIADNEVYDTDLALIFYDEALLGRYAGWFEAIFREPRYVDLAANLRHFVGLHDRLLRAQRPLGAWLDDHPGWAPPERERFAAFHRSFQAALARDRAAAAAALARLGRD